MCAMTSSIHVLGIKHRVSCILGMHAINRALSPGLSRSCNCMIKLLVAFRHWLIHLCISQQQCLLYIGIAFGFENIEMKNFISALKEIEVSRQTWIDKSKQNVINTLIRTWTKCLGGIEELTHSIFSKDWDLRAEEMAHQSRTLAPLPEDPSLVPEPTAIILTICDFSSISNTLLWPLWAPACTWHTYSHAGTHVYT